MEETLSLYDVLDDDRNVLNSQAIIGNICFEIPKSYFFNKDTTSLEKHILHLKNSSNFVRIYYEHCDENNYKIKIEDIRNKYNITEEFSNYRGQNVIEYESETGINVIGYDGNIVIIINCKCKKYSKEYFDLYFILYSFDTVSNGTYNNSYYQKNNYCVLKNGSYLYQKYNLNLLKTNPSEFVSEFVIEMFCKYINGVCDYDSNIKNYYVKKDVVFQNIVNKIKMYNVSDDDPSFMDIIDE